jgi:hypothetical protein
LCTNFTGISSFSKITFGTRKKSHIPNRIQAPFGMQEFCRNCTGVSQEKRRNGKKNPMFQRWPNPN